MHMKTVDKGIVAGGVVLSFILAFLEVGFTGFFPELSVVVILIGGVLAYMARDYYGGQIGRGLEVLAAGFIIYGVLWWPHKIGWHGGGTPAWAGIIEPAWQTFFHLLTVITLGIVAYGFYTLWQVGGGAE